ncbi:nucleotide exchange factor GrpE [Petrocella sp. FN5]|uniref:nucleotide exchange factor GrpE n=1 Tax=Petrocella sp. FN5 TaxID=3032002 RepID=UPI0023DC35C3|nr:nucleotide exchange factor GrpE [Petrocella sp. FN5]MDF1616661.1 nucleotide exchange factor GrpE [Petrocella sp. FN5]
MNRIVKENEIEKIVLEYRVKMHAIEDSTCNLIKCQIENISSRMLLVINQNLKNKDESKSFESLYYLMKDTKSIYEKCIRFIGDHEIRLENKQLVDIVTGIKEMAENAVFNLENGKDNPIAYERMVIISGGILKIKEAYRKKMDMLHETCAIDSHITKVELLDYIRIYVLSFFEAMDEPVKKIIKNILGDLWDSIEKNKYIGLLVEQKKVMEALMMVKVDDFKGALKRQEVDFLEALTSIIQDGYEQILMKEDQLSRTCQIEEHEIDLLSDEGIKQAIEKNMSIYKDNLNTMLKYVDENHQNSHEAFIHLMYDELYKTHRSLLMKIKKESTNYQILSCHILEIFDQLVVGLQNLNLKYKTTEGQKIGDAICDTIYMKYDTLKEKDTEYQLVKKDVSIIEDKKLHDMRMLIGEKAEGLLEEAIDGLTEGLLDIQTHYLKEMALIEEKVHKQNIVYLKNDILFELRTYEELMRHSLKKLMDLEGDHVKALSLLLIETQRALMNALDRVHIRVIEPHEHNQFDGKIHEAILAESLEGFEKGSIIKCQSVGYQSKSDVLLRAMVIAAK